VSGLGGGSGFGGKWVEQTIFLMSNPDDRVHYMMFSRMCPLVHKLLITLLIMNHLHLMWQLLITLLMKQPFINFILHCHLLVMSGVIRQQFQLSKYDFVKFYPPPNQPLIVSHSLLINSDFTWTLHVLGHEIEKHANAGIPDHLIRSQ
jgi:hypothetical protein